MEALTGVNENIFTPDFYAVAIHPYGWVLADFACRYIVLPPVPRAGHHVAVHHSLPQRPAPVQAGIVDGVELAANVRQGNRLALDLELSNRSWSKLIRLRCPRKRHCPFSLPLLLCALCALCVKFLLPLSPGHASFTSFTSFVSYLGAGLCATITPCL